MDHAFIDGAPAELALAAAAAARLLAASAQPLIAGLGTDVGGARAAAALALRVGAVLDHMHADALLRDLGAMQAAGMMLTAPAEARARADTLLVVGPGAIDDPLTRYLLTGAAHRRIFRLCPGGDPGPVHRAPAIGRGASALPVLLAALRARVRGRPAGAAVQDRVQAPDLVQDIPDLDGLAGALKAARFGVAVWSAQHLDALTTEMLCGLVDDLNAATRFSGVALPPGDNAAGVQQVCGWTTGFPLRTSLARPRAEHDPWQYRATRLVASGETDCVVWISAFRAAAPPWDGGPPAIVLAPAGAPFASPPPVHIAVGTPGRDHDAIVHEACAGTVAALKATRPTAAPSVKAALDAITAHLPGGEPSC